MLRAFAILALLSILTAQECDFELGSLKDFVKVYDVTVTNAADRPALVLVTVKDVSRRAVLAPGASTTVTSFSGGSYLVLAMPATDYLANLRKLRDDLYQKLQDKTLTAEQATQVNNRLYVLSVQIRSAEEHPQGGTCGGSLQPDSEGRGTSVSATATFEDGKFVVACG